MENAVQQGKRQKRENSPDRLTLTVDEAGELLGISRPTAFKLVKERKIPSLRLGRRVVIPRVAIQKLLDNASKPKEN